MLIESMDLHTQIVLSAQRIVVVRSSLWFDLLRSPHFRIKWYLIAIYRYFLNSSIVKSIGQSVSVSSPSMINDRGLYPKGVNKWICLFKKNLSLSEVSYLFNQFAEKLFHQFRCSIVWSKPNCHERSTYQFHLDRTLDLIC